MSARGHSPPDEPPAAHGPSDEPLPLPITGELDLHAFAPRDVPGVVRDYVQACREAGIAELRLVHGRGRGVQRAVVRRVLSELPGVGRIRDATPGWGGWGVTLAQLDLRVPGENDLEGQ